MMMLPIALSVASLTPKRTGHEPDSFSPALMLAVAYGATAGGMGTLIGTPPNALLAGYLDRVHGFQIGFAQWMLIGVPVVLLTLPIIYWTLTRWVFRLPEQELPGMQDLLEKARKDQGPISRGEWTVGGVFALTAIAWMFRPVLARWIPMISDTTIAMTGALVLFMIPVCRKKRAFAMDWEATKTLPWGVLLLFGGGLSLAGMIQKQGVSHYLGQWADRMSGWPIWMLVAGICLGILLLTELTSNTGTAATFLPIIGAIALSLGENPLLLLIPTALAANCSFMMPVGTPPNAIVFASGQLTLPQMARAGWLLNLLVVPLLVAVVWFLGPWVFGIQTGVLPDWVAPVTP